MNTITLTDREAAVQRGCCPMCWHPLTGQLNELDVVCHVPYCTALWRQVPRNDQYHLALRFFYRLMRQRVLLRECPFCGRPRRVGMTCGGMRCWHSWTFGQAELRSWLLTIRQREW